MTGDSVRDANAHVARMYDQAPWHPAEAPWLELEWLLGVSRLFGCGQSVRDVLDIGSGAGGVISMIGGQVEGRLVGIDISSVSCELARTRLAPFGERVAIHCADLASVEPDRLGRFDLIYVVGVYYVTPPAVQEKIAQIGKACLNPGGLMVVSYYAGPSSLVRASIYRTLRAAVTLRDSWVETARSARQALDALQRAVETNESTSALVRQAFETTRNLPDFTFYHEAFNPYFDAQQTTTVERRFRDCGLQFLGYLQPTAATREPSSETRALAADRLDLEGGAYQLALFGRPVTSGPPDPAAAGIAWSCSLIRCETEENSFKSLAGGGRYSILSPYTRAVIDRLIVGPAGLAEAESDCGMTCQPGDAAQLNRDILDLWALGCVKPLAV